MSFSAKKSARRCKTSFKESNNPFEIPDECDAFSYRSRSRMLEEEERKRLRTLTIAERTALLHPNIPPCVSQHSTRYNSALSTAARSPQPRTAPPESAGRSARRISEFVQQKRDIFLIQLLIDQKKEEIAKINRSISQGEKNYEEGQRRLTELSDKYKLVSAKSDQIVARQRRAAEEASCHKVELLRDAKRKSHDLALIRNEIAKNEDMLEQYTEFYSFLEKNKPKGKTVEWYFDDPAKLENDLEKLEYDNAFILSHIHKLEEQLSSGKSKYEDEISTASKALLSLQEEGDAHHITDDNKESNEIMMHIEKSNEDNENVSKQIEEIRKLILNTYVRMYGHNPNFSSLMMLNKINSDLEDLYEKVNHLDHAFYVEKQAEKDKRRRENLRLQQQKEKEIIQQEKKEAALKRANRPVKKKTGRPLLVRTMLKKNRRNDDEKRRRQALFEKRQEEFLFGDRVML